MNTTAGADLMWQFLPTSPFVGHLGIELREAEDGRALLALPFRDEVVTIGTTIHGGAIASLVDTAAMVASWSGAEIPEQIRGTTVALSLTYLAAATGEDLEAEARVLRRGRSLVFCDVDVRAGDKPIARGLVTYKIG